MSLIALAKLFPSKQIIGKPVDNPKCTKNKLLGGGNPICHQQTIAITPRFTLPKSFPLPNAYERNGSHLKIKQNATEIGPKFPCLEMHKWAQLEKWLTSSIKTVRSLYSGDPLLINRRCALLIMAWYLSRPGARTGASLVGIKWQVGLFQKFLLRGMHSFGNWGVLLVLTSFRPRVRLASPTVSIKFGHFFRIVSVNLKSNNARLFTVITTKLD